MPTIGWIDNIKVEMHYRGREHNPPHIHISSSDFSAVVDIESSIIIALDGKLYQKRVGRN